jgi:CTP synthase
LLEEQKNVTVKGASMRLGAQVCKLTAGARATGAYGANEVSERHRHRYEFNNSYRKQLEAAGLTVAGTSTDGELVELIELRDHPWFVASQFHPEFLSKPNRAHPLFRAFIAHALERQERPNTKTVSRETAAVGS